QRPAGVHAGVRRGHRARRGRRRHRRAGLRHTGQHGGRARPDPVRRHRGRGPGLAIRRVRRLAADRAGADLRGVGQLFGVRPVRGHRVHARARHHPARSVGSDARADRADHSLPVAGADPDLPADRIVGETRDVSEAAKIGVRAGRTVDWAGLAFGIIFGAVSTRRGGTVFAMISLGLGELVASSSLILRSFFGGEEGISTNRTKLFRMFDLSFGPQIQVYYLIAAWCLLCMIVMFALTRTPFGRMCNAVRDNPERAQFVGYNPYMVRFIAFSLAGLFAGIAGGLAAINFELVNASVVGAGQSTTVLLA